MPYTQSGKITISGNDRFISVWVDGRLAGVFTGSTGGDIAIVSNGNATVNVDWSALDNRVDNFILDMGRSGTQLLSRLVGEKPIFFQDDQYGNLHIFRDRVTINAGSPDTLTIVSGELDQDVELATRVRVEGAEVAEATDYDSLAGIRQYLPVGSIRRTQLGRRVCRRSRTAAFRNGDHSPDNQPDRGL